MPGTSIDVVPNVPKCQVPELLPYRTKHPEVFGTGIDVVPNLPKVWVSVSSGNGIGVGIIHVPGTDIDVVPNVPNC